MYAAFFGLRQEPFSLAPDPRYLFMSERHREALAHLLYGLGGAGGFVVLSGAIGAGKTTVCRCFLEQVPADCQVAYIFNPRQTAAELLHSVCQEFGIALPAQASAKQCVDALNAFLLQSHAQGRHAVLVIDEAQQLSADVLEQLRLLTNLETGERKLLQIMLIGQPELRQMLAQPQLEQLAQRVVARFHLEPLSAAETAQYVQHRLGVAGLQGASPFDAGALKTLYRLARGVPRRINLLADRAMLGAYASGQRQISAAIVAKAAREVFDDVPPQGAGNGQAGGGRRAGTRAAPLLAGIALGGGAVALAAWLQLRPPAAGVATAAATTPAATSASAAATAPAVTAPAVTAAISSTAPPASAAASDAAAAATETAATTASAAAPTTPQPAASANAEPMAGAATTAADSPGAKPQATVSAAGATTTVAAAEAPPPATPAAPGAEPGDAAPAFATLLRTERQGLRELAPLWRLATADDDPCDAAARERVQCWRGSLGLAPLRRLDRPLVLTLRDGAGTAGYALLVGLDDSRAWLRVGQRTQAVTLPALASMWRGEVATYWRTPPGWPAGSAAARAELAAWVDARLSRASADGRAARPATDPEPRAARIAAFQLAHGLKPDGIVGPLTLMLLGRDAGPGSALIEPRLQGAPAARR